MEQEKLCALSAAVQYQELSDATVWDQSSAMEDCAAILEVVPPAHTGPYATSP
jgi:hypothetical protein